MRYRDHRHEIGYTSIVFVHHGVAATWFPVTTHLGFVIVAIGEKTTDLFFVHNGMMHTRTVEKAYTPRYCMTLARRFAKEITEGVGG
jgi:hypothetical protein